MKSDSEIKLRPGSSTSGGGIAVGAALGVAFGAAFGHLAMALALGVAFGAIFDVASHVNSKRPSR